MTSRSIRVIFDAYIEWDSGNMQNQKLIISGGQIVDESHIYTADVAVLGDKIVAVGEQLDKVLDPDFLKDAKVVDAGGKYMLPGGVDAHTHMDLNVGFTRACDTWFTGTRAAISGGVTSICDHMAFGAKDCTLMSRVDEYHGLADGVAVCDYKFHGIITRSDDETIKEMEDLLAAGVNSAKIYMTYDGHVDDEDSLRVLRKAKELGMVVCVHAENHQMCETLRKEYGDAGHTEPIYHAISRPRQAEAEAIDRILRLASLAGDAPIYIVHLTTKDGLEVIKEARKRGQKNIFAETCTQYLTLTDECYEREDGLKFIMAPPLRKQSDIDALWEGVANGDIQVIATDHCPFTYKEQKQRGKDDFRLAPGGAPGVEERLSLVARGVEKGLISWSKMVETCMSNPARIFALEHKGFLEPGSDADILIIDPQAPRKITIDESHGACDYTCYEGIEVPMTINEVYLRGKLVFKDGDFVGDKGDGRYLHTGPCPLVEY